MTASSEQSEAQPEAGPEPQLEAEPEPQPAENEAPLNRAARRGKDRDRRAAAEHGYGGHARSAQGRRINPIRRTG